MPQEPTLLKPGTPDFAAYLNGFQEYHAARQAEKEARNLRLRLIGEVTEVVAEENLPITPAQIVEIAAAAQAAMNEGALAPDWTSIIRDFAPKNGSDQCSN
jgi:hypothetical protein